MPQIISNEHTTYIIPCICVCALHEREKNNYMTLFLKINKFLLSYFQCLRFLINTSKHISNSSFTVYSVSIIIRSCTKRYNVTGGKNINFKYKIYTTLCKARWKEHKSMVVSHKDYNHSYWELLFIITSRVPF